MQGFFDASGDAVAIRLPCRVRTGCCQPFKQFAEAAHSSALRLRHKVLLEVCRCSRRPKVRDDYKLPMPFMRMSTPKTNKMTVLTVA